MGKYRGMIQNISCEGSIALIEVVNMEDQVTFEFPMELNLFEKLDEERGVHRGLNIEYDGKTKTIYFLDKLDKVK